MTIELSPELEEILNEKVAQGECQSREEALERAVRLMAKLTEAQQSTEEERMAAVEGVISDRKRMKWDPGVTFRDLIEDGRKR